MAIQFARCQYVSRSTGGNACRKASYNQREAVKCERTGEVFSFKERGDNVHHEIILPQGADVRFQNSSVLWNEAERCEKRKDSQVAKEFVIALPDDKQISFEDRVELSRMFAQIFVNKGVAVQLDIHEPHEGDKNWHTHYLVTTRRFSEDGQTLYSKKAKDLDPVFRNGVVVEADLWGEIWRDIQNAYFKDMGYDIRVDPIGILAQEHLGPVRMRHHMNEAIQRSQMLQQANEKLSQDPTSVIEALTQNRAVFTGKDVEIFLNKHVPGDDREELKEKVLGHEQLIPLYDKETGQQTNYLTTVEVRAEEEKLMRFADRIASKTRASLDQPLVAPKEAKIVLSPEQKAVYDHCVNSTKNLCVIQGRAGVGKSTVLHPIRVAHEDHGFRVLGLAPTHKVALDLQEDGFKEAKTCHSFLFAFKNNRETLNSKTLVVVDEAGMMGTELSVELFHAVKTSGAKLLLVGDDRQLSSVARGGAFGHLAERYGAVELSEVRRQTIDWQKAVSEHLSQGDVKQAVHLLQAHKAIQWEPTKEEALTDLLKAWETESLGLTHPQAPRLILAQRNVDVDALNQGARDILKAQGKLGDLEVTCMTQRGLMSFSEGDRIQFTKTDRGQGLMNGHFGIIQKINAKTKNLTILLDNGQEKTVDPKAYEGLRHGYASTVYKAQGSTLDHVYVLHSNAITQQVNYVALTRQTKSLSLHVSREETLSHASLIRQMGRNEENKISLAFDIQKESGVRHQALRHQDLRHFKSTETQTFVTSLKQGAEKALTKIKDLFHKNEDFYRFERPKDNSHQEVSLTSTKVSPSSPLPPAQTQEHPVLSEELKRTMLGDEFYNRIYHPKQKTGEAPTPVISEDFKKTMLGEDFYNKVHRPKSKTGEAQVISEELKKTMLGEDFYHRVHGTKPDVKTPKAEKLSSLQTRPGAESSHTHTQEEEQKITRSHKPPSPRRKR